MDTKITSASIEQLLFLGVLEHSFTIGNYPIVYNLASIGAQSDAAQTARTEENRRAALMAASLVSINGYTFNGTADPLSEKYTYIRNLKNPVFEYMWLQYQTALAAQIKVFDSIMESSKKSLPSLTSDTGGDSAVSQGL